jgi:hypothetical protein
MSRLTSCPKKKFAGTGPGKRKKNSTLIYNGMVKCAVRAKVKKMFTSYR